MRKLVLLALFMGLVLMPFVQAKPHNNGYGSHPAVATDGFDNGYYLTVWVGSSAEGVYGALYYVYNNTLKKSFRITNYAASVVDMASRMVDATQPEDNIYFVVWKRDGDGGLYGVLLDYEGNTLSEIKRYDSGFQVNGNNLAVTYGNGYFVIVYQPSGQDYIKSIRYVVVDPKDGAETDRGFLYTGGINPDNPLIRIAYEKDYLIFGTIASTGDNVVFIQAKVNNGRLEIGPRILLFSTSKRVSNLVIAPAREGGFLVGYFYDEKWRVGKVDSSLRFTDDIATYGRYHPMEYGDMALIWDRNGINTPYIIFAYSDRNNANNYDIVLQKLKTSGDPIDDPGNDTMVISSDRKTYRFNYPAIVAKPYGSPSAYIITFEDEEDSSILSNEYDDSFREISPQNPVPFFSNLAIATVALLGILWFFRRN